MLKNCWRKCSGFLSVTALIVLNAAVHAQSPAGPAVQSDTGLLLESLADDPLAFRKSLVEQLLSGHPQVHLIEELEDKLGDRSFEGLKGTPASFAGLSLQSTALAHWRAGRLESAATLMHLAGSRLAQSGTVTEQAFSLYFEAEILSEAGQHDAATRLLETALALVRHGQCDLLEALLQQSLGYLLWFNDELPASTRCFGKALKTWIHLGYADGITASWNNLANLYEVLGDSEKAELCYLESLSWTTPRTDPLIRVQLFVNFASFLTAHSDPRKARRFLDLARPFRELATLEFDMAEAHLTGQAEILANTISQDPVSDVRRQVAFSNVLHESGKLDSARVFAQSAFEAAVETGKRSLMREAGLSLGPMLAKEGRFREAADLYEGLLEQSSFLASADEIFPFSIAADPILEGLVSNLVSSGNPEKARRVLRKNGQTRRMKSKAVVRNRAGVEHASDPSLQMALAAEAPFRRISQESDEPSLPISLPENTAVLELWPSGRKVFAWIDLPNDSVFRIIQLPEDPGKLVRQLTLESPSLNRALPPPPSHSLIREISRHLISPLEDALDQVERITIVPHLSLQGLPFELLEISDGRLLSAKYILGYLPDLDGRFAITTPSTGLPITYLSPDLDRPSRSLLEMRLRLDGGTRIVDSFDQVLESDPVPFIHLADHFRPDPSFWVHSNFGGSQNRTRLEDLLNRPLRCNLLSLAVCDAGISQTRVFPYSLGFSEFLLATGVESVVLSRWALDERSVEVFLDFQRRALQGESFDLALTQARNRAVRNLPKLPGYHRAHPFFWAGIIYVGWPGKSLYPGGTGIINSLHRSAPWIAGLLLLFTIWGIGRPTIRRRSPPVKACPSLPGPPQGDVSAVVSSSETSNR